MRYVVTGGAGFVGSHLTRALLAEGHTVDVIDDLSAGSPPPAGARLHRVDVAGDGWRRLADGATAVFHLASPIGVRRAHEQGAATVAAIVRGGLRIAEVCAEAGVPVVFTSSSEVYGAQPGAGLGEGRRWSYAAAKLAVEHLLLAADAGLPHVHVARLFNVVGPGQRAHEGHVLPTFCAAAVRGEALPVHGDGSARRVFLHVQDAVDALRLLAASPSLAGRTVDVGGTEECSVAELAERILARTGGSTRPLDAPWAPVHRRTPALGPLLAQGWRPRRTLQQAIDERLDEAAAALGTSPPRLAEAP